VGEIFIYTDGQRENERKELDEEMETNSVKQEVD
jgi:hypothetical protein